jgi:phosphoglycerate dehydrogenase-like enzyme
MRVLGAKRQPIESEWLDACYPISELDELLKQSDFVVLCLPLTSESAKLIGRHEFSVMKKNACLINIARGGVVDQAALVEALSGGQIAGAGLDVFDPEPLPSDSPLWQLPNVIITPHTGAQSPQYMDRAIEVAAENIRRYLNDEPLQFEVIRTGGN